MAFDDIDWEIWMRLRELVDEFVFEGRVYRFPEGVAAVDDLVGGGGGEVACGRSGEFGLD